MSLPESSAQTGVPIPARLLVRCGGIKLFGGLVFAVPSAHCPSTDEVWEVEVTFVRKLGCGRAAKDLRMDQVMTGPFISHPESLACEGDES